jgi:hypothetical protein
MNQIQEYREALGKEKMKTLHIVTESGHFSVFPETSTHA